MAKGKRLNDTERLARLHAAGLFQRLDMPMVERNKRSEHCSRLSVTIAEQRELEPLLSRELLSIPPTYGLGLTRGLGLERVLKPCGDRFVQLMTGPDAGYYEPERPVDRTSGKHPYEASLALVNAGLTEGGDERCYVALNVPDPTEPLFLLATPAQHRLLRELDLVDIILDGPELPEPMELDDVLEHSRKQLAPRLPPGIPSPVVTDDAMELGMSRDQVVALIEALYASHYHVLCVKADLQRRGLLGNP
jgi:hypothetical protein